MMSLWNLLWILPLTAFVGYIWGALMAWHKYNDQGGDLN